MTWAPVPGFDGMYEVSDTGDVRRARCLKVGCRTLQPRSLKPDTNKTGHKYIALGGRGAKRQMIHRLVWEAFKGAIPEGTVIRHLDGNPSNNSLQNLSPGSQVDNAHDCYNYGGRMGNGHLYREDVEEIRRLLAKGITQKTIAEKFGTTQQTISNISTKRTHSYF